MRYFTLVIHVLFFFSERAQYIPEETESPQFSIERKNEDSQSQQDIKLPLFASTSKEDSKLK